MSDRQEELKELREKLKELQRKDPLFAKFFDRFERSFYKPDNRLISIGLNSDEVSFDPEKLCKQFRYANENDVALDEATLLGCLLGSERFRERLGTNLEWAEEFKYHFVRSFNLAIEQLKFSQYPRPSPPTVTQPSTVRKTGRRKPREGTNTRRHLVRAFAESNPRTKGKNQNQLTCADLDSYGLEVPERWKREVGVESWVAGYKHKKVRALIASMFSKYRNED